MWKTIESCNECGASYEIDVWDLGHKERDIIRCECCGNTIKQYDEARSYSISKLINQGTLILKYEDWEKFKGKKLKFRKGAEEIEGVLQGLGDSVTALSPEKAVRLWLIKSDKGNFELYPESWTISIGKQA